MFAKKSRKKNLTGKLPFQVVGICIVIGVFTMGSALARELYREYQIKKEIDTLKSQINSMQKDNYQLSQFLDYYQTNEYKEAEARRRLNLKAEGEKVVMIDNANNDYEETQKTQDAKKENVPNSKKWWNYFFASHS